MFRSLESWSPRHDNQQVDLAFVVDCTGSMGSYISQTQRNINFIAETISKTSFSVRLALVEYRDHPPQETTFISRYHDFTHNVREMKVWVDGMQARGGGDVPEAVADGLHDALNLSYRQRATKICVWIGDAEPHGIGSNSDAFPDGCPSQHDPIHTCHQMAARGIILYCIGCEPSLRPHRDLFMAMSLITGGQYIRLSNARLMSQIIVNLAIEEVHNESLMGHVGDHLHLLQAQNPQPSVDLLAHLLHDVLRLNNNRARRMQYGNRNVEPITDAARTMSYMDTLAEVTALLRARAPPQNMAVDDHEGFGGVEITDLDEVSEWTCERLVRRHIARSGAEDDDQMH